MTRVSTESSKPRRPHRPRDRRPFAPTVLAAIALLVFLAVACGNDDTSPSASTDSEAPPTSTAADVVKTTTESTTSDEGTGDSTTEVPPETDGNEFIDLGFLSAFSNVEISIQPAEECDNSDPDLLVCEFEQAGDLQATHLGLARDTESGTMTTYLEESCTAPGGAVGNPVVWEATGQMATPMGDVANFRLRNNQCNADARGTMRAYWVIDGGTGRFADAYGLMSVMPWPGETLTVSTGTLSVRADLWQDTLPPLG